MIARSTRRLLPHRLALILILSITPGVIARAQSLTAEQIDDHLALLDAAEREEAEAMRCILSPERFHEMLAAGTPDAIRKWIDAYWDDRDPVFTTEENENRLEHDRRVEYARMYFLAKGWPGWDGRGEVYIRYGQPTVMSTAQEEVFAGGVAPPQEMWYYAMHDMLVRFEDPYRRGEYSYYQEHVYAPRGPGDQLTNTDIAAPMIPDLLPPEIALVAPRDQFLEKVRHFYEVIDATPSTYIYDFGARRLPYAFSIDNFRGGDDGNRVDVNFEFMADRTPFEDGRDAREYVATSIFRDFHGNTVERHEGSVRVPTQSASDAKLVPLQLSFSVPPGFYSVGVTLEERSENRLTSYKTDLTSPNMNRGLIVSDIVVASAIEAAKRRSTFNRGALHVVPHPSANYRQPANVPIYFEIYNLTPDARGVSTYDIEYEVLAATPRPRGFLGSLFRGKTKSAISSRFESSVQDSYDVVRLNLSTDNMWVSVFTLRVAIEDKTSGATANQEVSFRIVE